MMAEDETKKLFEAILGLLVGKEKGVVFDALAATVAFLCDEYGMSLPVFTQAVEGWIEAKDDERRDGELDS